MTARLVFTPRAIADIDQIHDHTATRWGPAQADAYIGLIRDRCAEIASGTATWRDAGHIRPGYRRTDAGAHVIFCRTTAETIVVVRILHAAMDFDRHL